MNATIERELKRMEVGSCGVKWDHVVWRVDTDKWQVGPTVNPNHAAVELDTAVKFLADTL